MQQVSDSVALPAGDGYQLRRIIPDGVQIGAISGGCHPRQEDQLRRLPAVQGKVYDALLVYNRSDPVLCVSTIAASASTSTCSLTEPTFKATSIVGLLSTCKTIPDWTYWRTPLV